MQSYWNEWTNVSYLSQSPSHSKYHIPGLPKGFGLKQSLSLSSLPKYLDILKHLLLPHSSDLWLFKDFITCLQSWGPALDSSQCLRHAMLQTSKVCVALLYPTGFRIYVSPLRGVCSPRSLFSTHFSTGFTDITNSARLKLRACSFFTNYSCSLVPCSMKWHHYLARIFLYLLITVWTIESLPCRPQSLIVINKLFNISKI